MTLIDFTYINSHGGLNITQYVLEYLSEREDHNDFLILLDKRNFLKLKTYNLKYNVIYKNEISRFVFYLKYKTSFDSIVCFANVPPPIKQNKKVKVYFHNELLLSTKGAEMTFIKKIILFFKKQYIRRLILAFVYASKKLKHKITLKLTIEEPKFNKFKLPQNFNIEYLGQLKHQELINHYSISKYLIFPSLKESFGLPLVEGFQSDCIILASDLNFVHEVLETKNVFNPYDIKDIAEKIITVLKNKKTSKQILKVSNLINKIFENEL